MTANNVASGYPAASSSLRWSRDVAVAIPYLRVNFFTVRLQQSTRMKEVHDCDKLHQAMQRQKFKSQFISTNSVTILFRFRPDSRTILFPVNMNDAWMTADRAIFDIAL